MLAVIIAAQLTCAPVNDGRAAGFTDAQIEQIARDRQTPEWMIDWAKQHCRSQIKNIPVTQR